MSNRNSSPFLHKCAETHLEGLCDADNRLWCPDRIARYWGNDCELHTEIGRRVGFRIETSGRQGFLVYGPYVNLEAGRYCITFSGVAKNWSGVEWVDVSVGENCETLRRISLGERIPGPWHVDIDVTLDSPSRGVEFRFFVGAESDISISVIELIKGEFLEDFAVLNKSYFADLEWSLVLYASFEKFCTRETSYYLAVPATEFDIFRNKFSSAILAGFIKKMPVILTEESIFERANIAVVDGLSGWQRQQIVKLAFAFTRRARNYLTIDSANIFIRRFDWRGEFFDSEGSLFTQAFAVSIAERARMYEEAEEKGWLNKSIVPLHIAFNAIGRIVSGGNERTHHYTSTTGLYSSFALFSLSEFVASKGFADFGKLIEEIPYELTWYGEYIFNHVPIPFVPKGPNLLEPCLSEDQFALIVSGEFQPGEALGILFQPPYSDRSPWDIWGGVARLGNR